MPIGKDQFLSTQALKQGGFSQSDIQGEVDNWLRKNKARVCSWHLCAETADVSEIRFTSSILAKWARRYVYIWADGVYLQARMKESPECMLLIIGATPEGKKELLGFQVDIRESAQSWRELLVEIKSRSLPTAPEIAVGDGSMDFGKALDEIFAGTKHQGFWVHKVKNMLNHFSKPMAVAVKFEKAVTCLTKSRDELLAFYDFPVEHWIHLRTSNPIESVFATVRHRTVRIKGALLQKTAKLMVFTLIQAASKKWLRLKGRKQLPKLIESIKFNDFVEVVDANKTYVA